jgi:hypothetical protein
MGVHADTEQDRSRATMSESKGSPHTRAVPAFKIVIRTGDQVAQTEGAPDSNVRPSGIDYSGVKVPSVPRSDSRESSTDRLDILDLIDD